MTSNDSSYPVCLSGRISIYLSLPVSLCLSLSLSLSVYLSAPSPKANHTRSIISVSHCHEYSGLDTEELDTVK